MVRHGGHLLSVVRGLLDSQEGLCSMELRRSINPNIFIVCRRVIVMSAYHTVLVTLPTNFKNFDNFKKKIHAPIRHSTFLTFQFPATKTERRSAVFVLACRKTWRREQIRVHCVLCRMDHVEFLYGEIAKYILS